MKKFMETIALGVAKAAGKVFNFVKEYVWELAFLVFSFALSAIFAPSVPVAITVAVICTGVYILVVRSVDKSVTNHLDVAILATLFI